MAAEEFYFYTKGMAVGYGGVPLIRDIELKVRRGEIPDTDWAERSGEDDDFKKHHPAAFPDRWSGVSGWERAQLFHRK